MRRLQNRRPTTLFRGGELPRLLTLLVMLGVLFMLVGLARDPATWRWLAPDAGEPAAPAPLQETNIVAAEPAATGPTDLDPDERDAAREELGALTDKTSLSKDEMPAYWRLVAWEQRQSTTALRDRAQKNITFKQLFQEPDQWRGKLVQIPLHLRRTEKVENLAENSLDLSAIFEVWGWNSESQPYWYWLVCPQLPPGMPTGASIYEEATFVGYFLKLLPYEDHQGKTLATPLLIGRLIWHPAASNPLARRDEWTWPVMAAAVVAALMAARWGLRLASRRPPTPSLLPSGSDEKSVADWLDRAESAGGVQSGSAPHDLPSHEESDAS